MSGRTRARTRARTRSRSRLGEDTEMSSLFIPDVPTPYSTSSSSAASAAEPSTPVETFVASARLNPVRRTMSTRTRRLADEDIQPIGVPRTSRSSASETSFGLRRNRAASNNSSSNSNNNDSVSNAATRVSAGERSADAVSSRIRAAPNSAPDQSVIAPRPTAAHPARRLSSFRFRAPAQPSTADTASTTTEPRRMSAAPPSSDFDYRMLSPSFSPGRRFSDANPFALPQRRVTSSDPLNLPPHFYPPPDLRPRARNPFDSDDSDDDVYVPSPYASLPSPYDSLQSGLADVLLSSIVLAGNVSDVLGLLGGPVQPPGPPLIRRSSIKKRSSVLPQTPTTGKRKRKAAAKLTAPKRKKAKRSSVAESEPAATAQSEEIHPLACSELSSQWTDSNTESHFTQLFSDYHALGASCLCENGDRFVVDMDRIAGLESEHDWPTNLSLAESIAGEVRESLLPQLSQYFETQALVVPAASFVDLSNDFSSPPLWSMTSSSSSADMIDLTDDGDGDVVIEIDNSQSTSQTINQTMSQSSQSLSQTEPFVVPSVSPSPLARVTRSRSQTLILNNPISLVTHESSSRSTPIDVSESPAPTPVSSSESALTEAQLVANTVLFLLQVTFLDEHTSMRHALFCVLSLVRCCDEVCTILTNQLKKMSPEQVASHVERTHRVLTDSLLSADAVNETVVGAVQFLSLIYDADAALHDQPNSVPLLRSVSVLHNETVNTRVDLGEDEAFYNSSITKPKRGTKDFRDSLRPARFTFTQFAHFLFTAESKSKLLRRRIDMKFVPETVEALRAEYGSSVMRFRHSDGPRFNPHMTLRLCRQHLTRDFFGQVSRIRDSSGVQALIKPMRIEFNNEEGVDAGGLKRECLTLVCADLFAPAYGMFNTDENTKFAYFNAFCQAHDTKAEMLNEFSMLGSVLALAILNDVLLELPFPPVVYKKLLGQKATFVDLEHSFPDYFRTLTNIMKYSEPDIDEALCLNFTVETSQFGATHCHYLKPGGDAISVNHSNKQEYCNLYSDYVMNQSVAPMFNAFKEGFWSILPSDSALRFMQPNELETMICGKKVVDFKALEKAAKYSGFSRHSLGPTETKPTAPVVRHLWSVLHSLDTDQKSRFLHFVTGQSSVPLGSLALQITAGGDDQNQLPSAKTCFSTLVLPLYKTKAQLKTKLLIALEHAVGFGNR